MGASTASKDRKERKDRSNKNQANTIKEAITKELGLGLGGKANNLIGKDQDFYGQEASKAANDAMVKAKIVKAGNYFRKEGGNFIRISREEGERLYAAGDSSISRSTIGSSNSNRIKYGATNGAMGSGDPSGAMTSIPISEKMLQQQNKILGWTTAALSFAVPGVGASVMRASASKNLIDARQSGAAYEDYTKKFDATQKGKKFTSQRNVTGIMALGLSKGKDKLGEVFGN